MKQRLTVTALVVISTTAFVYSCGKKIPDNVLLPLPVEVTLSDHCNSPAQGTFYMALAGDYKTASSGETSTASTNSNGLAEFKSSFKRYALSFTAPNGAIYTIVSEKKQLNIRYGFDTSSCSPKVLTFPIKLTADKNAIGNDLIFVSTLPGPYSEQLTSYTLGTTAYITGYFYPTENSNVALIAFTRSPAGGTAHLFTYYSSVSPEGLPANTPPFRLDDEFSVVLRNNVFLEKESPTSAKKLTFYTTLSLRGLANVNLKFEEQPLSTSGQGASVQLSMPPKDAFASLSNLNPVFSMIGVLKFAPNGNIVLYSILASKIDPTAVTSSSITRELVFKVPPKDMDYSNYTLSTSAPVKAASIILHITGGGLDWWIIEEISPPAEEPEIPIPYNPIASLSPAVAYQTDVYWTNLSLDEILTNLPSNEDNIMEAIIVSSEDRYLTALKNLGIKP